uniref:PH domain-containing protein n=1 Tax=Suricata suricatta TaxID=37032 RepID=A0A673UUX3_SURSU
MSPAAPVPPDSTLESPFEEMALVRGGWLWRQSSILRRWKRNWFALWLDGTLGYYRDETAQDEEDRVLIQFNVRNIKIGQECHDVQPPEGRSRDGLLTVTLREGSRLHLCAETKDDAIAWKTALLEANSTPVRVYSPYQDYYEVVTPNAHEATYVRSYYGPPYAGKSAAWPSPCPDPQPSPSQSGSGSWNRTHSCEDHGFFQAGPTAGPSPSPRFRIPLEPVHFHTIELTLLL